MDLLKQRIDALTREIESITPGSAEELEAYRIKFLGAKGIVKDVFSYMKEVPGDQKKEAGQVLNAFKQFAEQHYERFAHLQTSGSRQAPKADLSLPGPIRCVWWKTKLYPYLRSWDSVSPKALRLKTTGTISLR
jgi:phenylalanyl-tRNA synthetase alpha chain